jgi:hypothetical protein
MAAGQYDSSDNQAYMMTPELSAAMYDGTSSESSASSPLNCNVSRALLRYVELSNMLTIPHRDLTICTARTAS